MVIFFLFFQKKINKTTITDEVIILDKPEQWFMIGYFIYDIIYIYRKLYKKINALIFLHHILSIVILTYIHLIDSPYKLFINICYILLESTSLSLNITNSIKYFYPGHPQLKCVNLVNISIYGIVRILLYPINLGYGIYIVYNLNDTYLKILYIAPGSLLILLYIISVNWFIAMVSKYSQSRKDG